MDFPQSRTLSPATVMRSYGTAVLYTSSNRMASGSIRRAYKTGRFATWTKIVVSSTMCNLADGSLASLQVNNGFPFEIYDFFKVDFIHFITVKSCWGPLFLQYLKLLNLQTVYQPGRVLHGQFDVAVLPVPNVNPALVRLEPSHEEPGRHGKEPSQVDVGRVESEEHLPMI